MAKKGKGKGKGKKVVLILLILILLGGGVAAGLHFTGRIKIPFLPKRAAPKPKGKPEAKKEEKPKPPVPKVVAKVEKTTSPPPDPSPADKKLAKLWNEIEIAKLIEITKDWREPDLARVLARMDSERVAELLSTVEPKRASALSRALHRQTMAEQQKPATP